MFDDNKCWKIEGSGTEVERGILVEVSEQVDAEGVLLVQLVAVSVLHCFVGVTRAGVLQEDVPGNDKLQLSKYARASSGLRMTEIKRGCKN